MRLIGLSLALNRLGRGVDAALELMRSAQSWYSSKAGGGQTIVSVNAPPGGVATVGSSSSDTNNDPTFLEHTGTDYVWLPGNANANYLQTPHATANDFTSVVQVTARLQMRAGSGTTDVVASKRKGTVPGDTQYQVQVTTAKLLAAWDGSTFITSTTSPAVSDGDMYWARWTLTDGAAPVYEWAADQAEVPTSWTTLTSNSGTHTLTSDPTLPLWIGVPAENTTGNEYFGGIIKRVMLSDGSNPTSVDMNPAYANGQDSWVAETGETWTVNRSTSGLKTAVVTRPVYLFDGVDDFLQLPAADTPTFTATTGKHTVVVAGTSHDAAAEYVFGLYASQSGSQGLTLYLHNNGWTRTDVQGSSSSVTAYANIVATAGEPFVIAAVVDDGTVASYMDNGSASGLNSAEDITGVGTISMSDPYIGYRPSASQYYDAEFFDVLSFPGVALTEAELDDIAAKLKAGSYSSTGEDTRYLNSAESWYSSKDGGQGQEIGNRNGTGDAVLGSSSSDTNNDPTFLDHTGEDYVWTPGNAGNDVYAADQASFDVSGNLTIQARLTFHATNGVFQFYRDDGGSDRWCYFTLANSGQLQLRANTDGGAHFYQEQIPAEYRVTGQELEVQGKVEFAGGNATLSVWYRLVGDTTWIQVGSDSVQTGTAMAASSQDIHVGGNNLGTSTGLGRIYWVKMYDDDTLVASFDAAEAEQTSWASSTGETWTVNRSTSGLKTAVVTRPVYAIDGTDDFLQLPASDTPTFTATTGEHTVVVTGRLHSATSDWGRLYSSESAGDNGLLLGTVNATDGLRVGVGDGTGSLSSITLTTTAYRNGDLFVVAAVCDNGNLYGYTDTEGLSGATSYTGRTGLTHTTPRVGGKGHAIVVTDQADAEIFDVLSFPGVALAETELDLIAVKLKAGTYSAD